LSLALLAAACSPSSRAEDRPEVIPTPPVLSVGDEETPRIGVRAVFISYAGAENAPRGVTRTREQARERAEMVATVAQMSGERFVELERKYSDRPPLRDGGGPGILLERGGGVLDPAVEKAAFGLTVGEVSQPIATPEGWVIVARTETPDGGPSQIGARHILVAYKGATRAAPEVTRSKEEARKIAEKVAEEVKAGADWDALWREHSDEPGGREGGDLGLFERGQMVPAFESTAFGLTPGETSDVVETPFGFHVIQRTR
jgi:parvulin-like peptidyl-prolyl isomerase